MPPAILYGTPKVRHEEMVYNPNEKIYNHHQNHQFKPLNYRAGPTKATV